MKYLIWLVIVFAGIWWIRQQRKSPSDNTSGKTGKKAHHTQGGPQEMVPCAHCGVHLPDSEALQGQKGVYCSEAHRQRQEG